MKQIEIEGKSYNIDCNAFTPVQYKAFFKESKRNSKRHNKIEDYENWLKSIEHFKIDDQWIVEVTEFAVDCFLGW